MSAASAVRLVAGREVRERGRSKVFWVGTSVVLLGVVAAIVVPAMFGRHGQQAFRVGTVGAAPPGLASSSSRMPRPWAAGPVFGSSDQPQRPAPRSTPMPSIW